MTRFSYLETGENMDILNSVADAIVIPVNCVGVMGAGLALQFKRKFPDAYKWYVEVCLSHELHLGKVALCKLRTGQTAILFPTKNHWREQSDIGYIEEGLRAMRWVIEKMPEIEVVAVPKIGCGLGGLRWRYVNRKIIEVLSGMDDKYLFQLYATYTA